MALNIITWLWGDKYGAKDVVRLKNACRDNLYCEHKFNLFNDGLMDDLPFDIYQHPIRDAHLMDRNCFCRLRMFDPIWQQYCGFEGKIVSLDLDLIITGQIDHLFAGDVTFKILKGANAANPCPYNASIMMLRSGCHPEVWNDFSVEKASNVPFYEFPDDQGWIWHKLPNAEGWQVGKPSGIYAFQKPGWPGGTALPADARIVTFIGWRKPSKFADVPWIRQHLTAAA